MKYFVGFQALLYLAMITYFIYALNSSFSNVEDILTITAFAGAIVLAPMQYLSAIILFAVNPRSRKWTGIYLLVASAILVLEVVSFPVMSGFSVGLGHVTGLCYMGACYAGIGENHQQAITKEVL